MSSAPGVCRIWLLVWLLPFDWCPASDDAGAGGCVETLNMEVWTNGGGFGTSGCESDCELGCEPCQSWSEPKISCFFRFLPV